MGLGQVPGKDQSCGVMRHPHAQGSLCFCPDYKYFPSLSWLGEMVNLGWGSTWGVGLRLRLTLVEEREARNSWAYASCPPLLCLSSPVFTVGFMNSFIP